MSPTTLEMDAPEWLESALALECASNLDEEDERAGTLGYV